MNRASRLNAIILWARPRNSDLFISTVKARFSCPYENMPPMVNTRVFLITWNPKNPRFLGENFNLTNFWKLHPSIALWNTETQTQYQPPNHAKTSKISWMNSWIKPLSHLHITRRLQPSSTLTHTYFWSKNQLRLHSFLSAKLSGGHLPGAWSKSFGGIHWPPSSVRCQPVFSGLGCDKPSRMRATHQKQALGGVTCNVYI